MLRGRRPLSGRVCVDHDSTLALCFPLQRGRSGVSVVVSPPAAFQEAPAAPRGAGFRPLGFPEASRLENNRPVQSKNLTHEKRSKRGPKPASTRSVNGTQRTTPAVVK